GERNGSRSDTGVPQPPHARHVLRSRSGRPVRHFGTRGRGQYSRSVSAPRDVRSANEHDPRIRRPGAEHPCAHALQIRQAARLHPGLGHVPRKTSCLFGTRTGPGTHAGLPAGGRFVMPLTAERYTQSLSAPPLSEQLRIRDLLENVAVQIDGSLVAGYEVGGIQSYYASDEG